MHGSVRDRLEHLLAAEPSAAGDQGLRQHLSSCAECSSELKTMRAHSAFLRLMRAPEQVEPEPGFYARVLQRIEERTKDSIWGILVYSPFGKRLACAALAVAVLLGSYVITQEARDGHLGGESIVAQQLSGPTPIVGDQNEQRDAVLANFASQQGSLP